MFIIDKETERTRWDGEEQEEEEEMENPEKENEMQKASTYWCLALRFSPSWQRGRDANSAFHPLWMFNVGLLQDQQYTVWSSLVMLDSGNDHSNLPALQSEAVWLSWDVPKAGRLSCLRNFQCILDLSGI